MQSEIAAQRKEESFSEAANSAADLIIYEMLADFPPSNPKRFELIRKITERFGSVLNPYTARAIVDRLIVDEINRRKAVERAPLQA